MKRFYSHFTFIYPTTYLKNVIVELDNSNRIIAIFPFEREVERTSFHSGWLLFLPQDVVLDNAMLIKMEEIESKVDDRISFQTFDMNSYTVYNDNGAIVL